MYVLALILWALPFVLTLGLAYLVSRKFLKGFEKGQLGIRREGLLDSFLYSSSICILNSVLFLFMVRLEGFSEVASSLIASGVPTTPLWIAAPFSLLIFFIVGAVAYPLWVAFPANLLKGEHWSVRIVVGTLLWIRLYDGGFIFTGSPPPPGDVLLLGFAFILIYNRFQNSLGLILAYVITGEWVVLAIPAFIGPSVLYAFLYARIAVSLGSICLLIHRRMSTRYNHIYWASKSY